MKKISEVEENKENEKIKDPSIIEQMGIIWKNKLTAAEWLEEQSEIIKNQYNTWITLMPKCMNEGRINSNKIRMLPVKDFLDLVKNFLKHFGLSSEEDFLEKVLRK